MFLSSILGGVFLAAQAQLALAAELKQVDYPQ